jgi:hypothetical protein
MCVTPKGSEECFDRGGKNYSLVWASQGSTFFDTWNFGEQDYTNGAVRYVGREEALKENLTVAHEKFAIVRPGRVENSENSARRKSLRLTTQKSWTYYLVAMKYSHTPFGCGVWPAFWSNGASGNWPTDGELDILEYWNDVKAEVSLHTAVSEQNGCKLDKALLNKKGCPHFPDVNNAFTRWHAYDCQTDYTKFPQRLGCAPTSNASPRKTGEEYSNNPGVMAAEWTKEYIKVFYIPEAQIPKDLESGAPQPDTWDQFIISYYPFADSEKASPGSCNLTSRSLSSAQALVLNIELCGQAGSETFPSRCHAPWPFSTCSKKSAAGKGDCCTEYMTDPEKSDDALAKDGFFNISYIKIWQEQKVTGAPKVDDVIV